MYHPRSCYTLGKMNTTSEKFWNAIVSRDTQAVGKLGLFFYAVKTTGIYCLPGCSSRTPKRENTEFFKTHEEAEKAGYRPCKRCRPDEGASIETTLDVRTLRVVASACRKLESEEQEPSLEVLASLSKMSESHFHKLFKKTVGLTPHEYAAAVRTKRFLSALSDGQSVTEAIYEAGYSAPSRAYEELKKQSELTPAQHKKGAPDQCLQYAVTPCHLGWVIIAITEKGLCSVMLGDAPALLPELLKERFPNAKLRETSPGASVLIARAVRELDSGNTDNRGEALPLDIRGTAFQKRVWKALQTVPAGQTATYAEIAAKIGSPKSVRAVANACGANKLALFIPCHRIIRSDGQPGGYRWGIHRKLLLIEEEKTFGSP